MAIGMRRKRSVFGDRAPDVAATQPESEGFNFGNAARSVAGNIGDAISTYYGGAPVFGPMERQREAFQQRAQLLAEQQRQQSLMQGQRAADQRALYDYKIANPAPTALERDIQTLGGLGISQNDAVDRLRPQQVQVVPLPGGRTYVGPNSGLEAAFGAGQGAPRPTQPSAPLPRPQGKTDDQLFKEAREAVEGGANVDAVFRQLRDWGVQI